MSTTAKAQGVHTGTGVAVYDVLYKLMLQPAIQSYAYEHGNTSGLLCSRRLQQVQPDAGRSLAEIAAIPRQRPEKQQVPIAQSHLHAPAPVDCSEPTQLRQAFHKSGSPMAPTGVLTKSFSSVSASDVSRALQQALTSGVGQHLLSKGYAVVDNLFHPSSLADAFRQEIVTLFKEGRMHKNCTHLVRGDKTELLEKSHIWEAELTHDPAVQQYAPLCSHINADQTLATMLSLYMPQRLEGQGIKLQYNAGHGGCFPCHQDTDALLDGRRVTAIFYLNPQWQPQQGGQLKLYPWPQSPVLIEPRHNRLVLFSSTRMLHRVLPSQADSSSSLSAAQLSSTTSVSGASSPSSPQTGTPLVSSEMAPNMHAESAAQGEPSALDTSRCCFTIWLSQALSRKREQKPPSLAALVPPAGSSLQEQAKFLLHPYMYPYVLKLVHAAEWEQSLKESHPSGPALEALIQEHRNQVAMIGRVLKPYAGTIEKLATDPQMAQNAAVKWFG